MEAINQFVNWTNANPGLFLLFCAGYAVVGLCTLCLVAGAFGLDTPVWLMYLIEGLWPVFLLMVLIIVLLSFCFWLGEKLGNA